jgi:2-C-methyl-D-erythritol 2,4-cyclodiphosphate synthase
MDIHPFDHERKLVLGGVNIDHIGLRGHSDADVLLHVVAESILGALALGDLGTHFPDSDPQYRNKPSRFFVETAVT